MMMHALLLSLSFFIEGTQAAKATTDMSLAYPYPSVTPTPSILFIVDTPPSLKTCGSSIITWLYSGPGDPMTLQVTNVGVSQDDPPPTTSSPMTSTSAVERSVPITPPVINLTLASNIPPSSPSFLWNPVNISQGWYVLLASIPTERISRSTQPFFVFPGTNTSCLVITSSTPSTTLSSLSATSIISQSPTSTPSSVLSSASSDSSTSNIGIILGVSIGIAVLAISVLSLWLCISRNKKSRTTSTGSPNSAVHQWNGLSSTDSGGFAANAPIKRYQFSHSHLNSHPDSIATSIGPDFDDVMILGAEKGSMQLNLNGNKDVFEGQQAVALSILPVLHHQSQRTRQDRAYSASSSSLNVNDLSSNRHTARGSTHRRPSDTSSFPPPSFPISPRDSQYIVTPSHSLSSTLYSSEQISRHSTTSLPPPDGIVSRETKQMYRQSLGKKRKPVPVYNPSSGEEQPVTPTTPTFGLPLQPPPPLPTHELSHKSSFGPGGIEGKPLHYLIPDMPMPTNR